MAHCEWIPGVETPEGKKSSLLFQNLMEASGNRDKSILVYEYLCSKEYRDRNKDKAWLDENGQPTLGYAYLSTDLDRHIPMEETVRKYDTKIGRYASDGTVRRYPYNQQTRERLEGKASEFNKSNPLRGIGQFAVMERKEASGKKYYDIGFRKIQGSNEFKFIGKDGTTRSERVNTRIRGILAEAGVAAGAYDHLVERGVEVNGITDFSSTKKTAEGLTELIRIAKGRKGEEALPEEFAHFVLEALGSNPLKERLVRMIKEKGLSERILGDEYKDYVEYYQGNEDDIAMEAAGKLLYRKFLAIDVTEEGKYVLLDRTWEKAKGMFGSIDENRIMDTVQEEQEKVAEELALQVMNGELRDEIRMNNISIKRKMPQINSKISKEQEILKSILDTELKRLNMYREKTLNERFIQNQSIIINKLKLSMENHEELKGILEFMEYGMSMMEQLDKRMNSISTDDKMSMKHKAFILNEARNYFMSYEPILNNIREFIVKSKMDGTMDVGESFTLAMEQMSEALKQLKAKYNIIAEPMFIAFLKQYLGDGITITGGKDNGKKISFEDIMKNGCSDIGFMDRWLNSMANANDVMLNSLDYIIKQTHDEARQATIEVAKKIEEAHRKLQNAGIHDTSWMIARNGKGEFTTHFITEEDYVAFYKAMREEKERLDEKYGKQPSTPQDNFMKKREFRQWLKDNTVVSQDGKNYVPDSRKYPNRDFQEYMKNTARKEYYEFIMALKKQLDEPLGSMTELTRMPLIRKDIVERVKSSRSVKEGASQVWTGIKDMFIRRSDDEDFGSEFVTLDFEGKEIYNLPVYYLKMREGESMNDMSTDITSNMMAYASMALDYKAMDNVIDQLEMARTILRKRKTYERRGEKNVVEEFTESGVTVRTRKEKAPEESKFVAALNSLYKMQVYQRYMEDEGNIHHTKIDVAKAANALNSLTALSSIGFSLLSAISNVATGTSMMRIEAIAGEHFRWKDLVKADKDYFTNLFSLLGELGNNTKTSKLALWNELFSVDQHFRENIRNKQYDRKSWFSRIFNSDLPYFMQNMGEHWMMTRTSLALANNYKLYDRFGQEVSLWDAMEVEYTDPNDHRKGARLVIRKDSRGNDMYLKKDGTRFDRKDIFQFRNKTDKINQDLHGIYNKEDMNAFKTIAVGRMVMMFRNWIIPNVNKRFQKGRQNLMSGNWEEGYYRTTAKFAWQLIKDIRHGQFMLMSRYKSLSRSERKNIVRWLVDNIQFLALSICTNVVEFPENRDSWILSLIEYHMRRLRTELGVLTPSFSMANEILKIIRSPAAGVNMAESLLSVLNMCMPWRWNDVVQSGRFKGQPKIVKAVFDSPFVPFFRTMMRNMNPDEAMMYYLQ